MYIKVGFNGFLAAARQHSRQDADERFKLDKGRTKGKRRRQEKGL